MKITNVKIAALLLASTALIAGCSKKKVEPLPPVAEGTDTGGQVDPNAGAGQIVPGSQEDFLQSVGQSGDHILFDTDRFNIDAQDQATLQSQAQWLARYPNSRVSLEGHADERGTREYNLALGERRAQAARAYLISLGIPAERLKDVSYGKEFPFDPGATEEAYAKNRRAHFVVTSK